MAEKAEQHPEVKSHPVLVELEECTEGTECSDVVSSAQERDASKSGVVAWLEAGEKLQLEDRIRKAKVVVADASERARMLEEGAQVPADYVPRFTASTMKGVAKSAQCEIVQMTTTILKTRELERTARASKDSSQVKQAQLMAARAKATLMAAELDLTAANAMLWYLRALAASRGESAA